LIQSAKRRASKLEAKGVQVSLKDILRLEPDCGVTNIRNISSSHWKRWLRPVNRCLVPFTSFSEYDTTNWTSVRKAREGESRRPLWFSHLPTECRSRKGPPEGDAADQHDIWMGARLG
jgi:putative SOS response-associated peptidase YedK